MPRPHQRQHISISFAALLRAALEEREALDFIAATADWDS
jgi:hypothetical protein